MRTQIILSLLLTIPAAASAAENALDFAYRVTGAASYRPLLVFNDGADTYIQPNPSSENIKFVGANADRQGPYYVIRGLANDFTIVTGKNSVSVTYQGLAKKSPLAIKPVQQTATANQTANAQQAVLPTAHARPSSSACKRHQSDSAYIVTFPRNSAVMTKNVLIGLKEALFIPKTIDQVSIVAEGSGNLPDLRAAAIKKVLAEAGIKKDSVETSRRDSTGIGSELRIHHVISQCNEIKVKGLRENAKVVWDGDAGELLSAIASSAGMAFKQVGSPRTVNVQVNATGTMLIDVLKEVGRQIGGSGDVVLRDNEIQIKYN